MDTVCVDRNVSQLESGPIWTTTSLILSMMIHGPVQNEVSFLLSPVGVTGVNSQTWAPISKDFFC